MPSRWSPQEDKVLIERCVSHGYKDVAAILNRTVRSVEKRWLFLRNRDQSLAKKSPPQKNPPKGRMDNRIRNRLVSPDAYTANIMNRFLAVSRAYRKYPCSQGKRELVELSRIMEEILKRRGYMLFHAGYWWRLTCDGIMLIPGRLNNVCA